MTMGYHIESLQPLQCGIRLLLVRSGVSGACSSLSHWVLDLGRLKLDSSPKPQSYTWIFLQLPACRVITLLVMRRTLTFETAVSILHPFSHPEIFLPVLLCICPFSIAAFYCLNEEISDQCRVRVNSSPVQMQLHWKAAWINVLQFS